MCVPTMGFAGSDEPMCEHFGRALTYTFVDTDSGRVEVIMNTTLHVGGEGYPPDLIGEHGGEVMICGGLGRRAVDMFADRGITVYLGASGLVSEALALWRTGRLKAATLETACQEHAFRGEEHVDGGHHQHHHG
ncbi:MAG: NifB/NifX family molybdenum-iron cluster-binding protein [Candidatus Nanopelagicales bacterium]